MVESFAEMVKSSEEAEVISDPQEHYQTTTKDDAKYKLDTHGHLIVKHDLFNHDGITQDGIAEAFIEFAKKERFSFF